jgi:hypothetical protein
MTVKPSKCCSIAEIIPKMVRGAADSTRIAITPV